MLSFDGFYGGFILFLGTGKESLWLWRFFPDGTLIKNYRDGGSVKYYELNGGGVDNLIKECINQLYFHNPDAIATYWHRGEWRVYGNQLNIETYFFGKYSGERDDVDKYHAIITSDNTLVMDFTSDMKHWKKEQFFNNQQVGFSFNKYVF